MAPADNHFVVLTNAISLNAPLVLGQLNCSLSTVVSLKPYSSHILSLQSKLAFAELDILSGTNLDFIETLTSSTSTYNQLTYYAQVDKNFFDVKDIEAKL
jgi:hypothetical protein